MHEFDALTIASAAETRTSGSASFRSASLVSGGVEGLPAAALRTTRSACWMHLMRPSIGSEGLPVTMQRNRLVDIVS